MIKYMNGEEIRQAQDIIWRLENGRVVQSKDFARIMTIATGQTFKPTNCVPCIKSALKKLKGILSQSIPTIIEEKIVEPTPILEEKIIKKNGTKKK